MNAPGAPGWLPVSADLPLQPPEMIVAAQPALLPARARVRLEGVEAGRGIAALLVLLYHAALHVESNVPGSVLLWGLPHFGHAGVDFFFVLSGFIITFVHRTDLGRPARLGHYLERRFTRVFPLYWLVLAFSLLGIWLLHRAQFPGAREFVANLLLLPQSEDKIVGGAWTLVYEIMFYCVFAIAICNRLIGAAVLCVWAVLVAVGFFLSPASGSVLAVAMSPFCIEFFLGIGAAAILSRYAVPRSGLVLAIGLAGFALAGVCEITGRLYGFGAMARVAYGICSFLVILGVVEHERLGRLKVPRFMAILGRASYSVYLVHLIAIGITFKFLSIEIRLTPEWSLLVWSLLCTTGLIGGIAASIWLEQPLIRFARKRLIGASK